MSPRDTSLQNIMRIAKNNVVDNSGDWKSVIKHCFYLNEVVILWNGKEQRIIYIFTIEVDYIIFKYVIKEVV